MLWQNAMFIYDWRGCTMQFVLRLLDYYVIISFERRSLPLEAMKSVHVEVASRCPDPSTVSNSSKSACDFQDQNSKTGPVEDNDSYVRTWKNSGNESLSPMCWLTLAFPGGWSNWNETWHQETPTHRLGRCQPFPASHPNNWPIPSSKKHVPPWVPAACPGVQSFQPQSIRATRLALHYLLITSWSLVGWKLHAQTRNQNCQHIATYRKYLSK